MVDEAFSPRNDVCSVGLSTHQRRRFHQDGDRGSETYREAGKQIPIGLSIPERNEVMMLKGLWAAKGLGRIED
eukprot:1027047-Prorocentrum_lima.AAC.1